MLIRTAQPDDAPSIAQVHVETWREAYRGQIPDAVLDSLSLERRTAFWREQLTQPRGPIFVAEQASVFGFCDLLPSRDPDANPQAVAEIAAIYVLPQRWRQGAGRALCEQALAEAQQQGYASVTLWVLQSNEAARRFYEAMGFRPDGATKTKQTADGSDLHEVRYRITI
jgi:ribosomal protein S18 acetylase RimI-like enzyme